MRTSKEFYDAIAGDYRKLSGAKQPFLNAVDEYIIARIGQTDNYMDVGAGDGCRSLKIANCIKAKNITLVDNSPLLISSVKPDDRIDILIDSISNVRIDKKFGLITCLWNVLGHVGDLSDRTHAINTISHLLSPKGTFVLDLNNRYNIGHYGYVAVMKNMTSDVKNDPQKGWFSIGEGNNKSRVYIHAPLEIDAILEKAGLVIEETYYVDYRTGERRSSFFEGQLLYFIRKNNL